MTVPVLEAYRARIIRALDRKNKKPGVYTVYRMSGDIFIHVTRDRWEHDWKTEVVMHMKRVMNKKAEIIGIVDYQPDECLIIVRR